MGYIDTILDEFKGQLSIQDIYHMTYKEINYLRQHRAEMVRKRGHRLSDITI